MITELPSRGTRLRPREGVANGGRRAHRPTFRTYVVTDRDEFMERVELTPVDRPTRHRWVALPVLRRFYVEGEAVDGES